MAKKIAIILANLGGPNSISEVRPFLFRLFNDVHIVSLPQPFRYFIALLISARRAAYASQIYKAIGGKSPLLEETNAQAALLDASLPPDSKSFVVMRYAKPMIDSLQKELIEFAPDHVRILPLYPQFSTTTTRSSVASIKHAVRHWLPDISLDAVCCYYNHPAFIQAHIDLIQQYYKPGMRLIFSAHGLPKKIVDKGDIYPKHIEKTIALIVEKLGLNSEDWRLAYQSRVGPLAWIGPSLDEVVEEAGCDHASIAIVPISFVSEHSETLYELDIEYKKIAKDCGVKEYIRIPALQTHPKFIDCLAELCHTDIQICAFEQCELKR